MNLIDPSGHSWFSKLFKAIGQFFTNLVKNPVQTILSVIAIAVAIIVPTPASPWIIASASLNLVNNGTSSWQGGGWNTIHQVVGYASLACAAVGVYQSFAAATMSPEEEADSQDAAEEASMPADGGGDATELDPIVVSPARVAAYQAAQAGAASADGANAGWGAGAAVMSGAIDGFSGGAEAFYGKTAETFSKYAPGWKSGATNMKGMAGSYAGVGAILAMPGYINILNNEAVGNINMGQAIAALTVHTGGIAFKVLGGAGGGFLLGALLTPTVVGETYGVVAGAVAGGSAVGAFWDPIEDKFYRNIGMR